MHRNGDLCFSQVKYLGAAASIRDFSNQAIPYLLANPTTTFHSETLHPSAERREWNFWYLLGAIPRGSLLVWIDMFLTQPRSKMDMTMGSWNNIVDVLPQIHFMESEARRRLDIESHGLGDDDLRTHASLNDLREGRPQYWETGKGQAAGKMGDAPGS